VPLNADGQRNTCSTLSTIDAVNAEDELVKPRKLRHFFSAAARDLRIQHHLVPTSRLSLLERGVGALDQFAPGCREENHELLVAVARDPVKVALSFMGSAATSRSTWSPTW